MALIIKKKSQSALQEVLQMRSFSTPEVAYHVDRINKTCTCEQFAKEGKCKHMEAAGVYPPKGWNAPTYPSFSQALSGLVKCLRLRRVDEAVYWLLYLNNCKQDGGRFRIARRLLIGSAEDGHSIAVMERVSRNFPHLCEAKTHIIELAAEVLRICTVPNWWDSATNGRDYIRSGMVANRLGWLYNEGGESVQEQITLMEAGVHTGNPIMAMTSLEKMLKTGSMNRVNIAKMLSVWCNKHQNEPANRLVEIHLTHRSALSGDSNFLGQALWVLAGGTSPVFDDIGVVMAQDVKEHLATQIEKMKTPAPIPAWCCDGIHCGGVDRRFAGIWHDMMAVCNVFDQFGTVDVNMAWKPEFFSLEGLKYE